MAKKLATVWALDPHTAVKHQILKIYLEAWLPIMGTWNGRILFIDGFAGPGKYSGGEDGSPVIALKTSAGHSFKVSAEVIFVFIEKDTPRFEHLTQLVDSMKSSLPSNFKIELIHGAFDEEISKSLDYLQQQNKNLAPALVFIDPFGFSHTPFVTIARLLGNKRCDALITFMFEEINRFLVLPEQAANYDKLFGTEEWRKALNLPTSERKRFLHDLYVAQLKKHAKYVRSFEMVNRSNATDYYLIFASNNLKGLQKMKEAMWRADTSGNYGFSDFTDAKGVQSLFAGHPNFEHLKELLLGRFAGQEVSIEGVEEFVVADTPYLSTHYKTQILKPLEAEGKIEITKAKSGRRRGTFSEGTVLAFKKQER